MTKQTPPPNNPNFSGEKPANKKRSLYLLDISIAIFVLLLIVIVLIVILSYMGTIYEGLPPPNSTQEWKSILKYSKCEWYELGCQKLACVIDCTQINEAAGEKICVC